jgi:hypothetical protein
VDDVLVEDHSVDVVTKACIMMHNHLDTQVLINVHTIIIVTHIWPNSSDCFTSIFQDYWEPFLVEVFIVNEFVATLRNEREGFGVVDHIVAAAEVGE